MKYQLLKSTVSRNARRSFPKNHLFVKALLSICRDRTISSEDQYNKLLKEIIKQLQQASAPKIKNEIHTQELPKILNKDPLSEKTPWGGVALKKVDVAKDFIQKLLVINQLGILGFEIHRQKQERLRVLEGFCIVLFSNHNRKGWRHGNITVQITGPDDRFVFQPEDEHGIIALTSCVIQESSTNNLDDLVYIFKSKQMH